MWLLFYLEVGDVYQAQDQPPRPRYDVAWQSLNMDLFIAEVCCEAGLGGADVAAHFCQVKEEPATWKVACCCAVDTDSPPVGASNVGPNQPLARRQVDLEVH